MPICLPSFVGVAQPASGGTPYPNQYSISLDGSDDYLGIPDSTALETTAFTWSAWFYCTAISRHNPIVDTSTNGGTFDGYHIRVNSTNKIRFASYNAGDSLDSTTTVSANTWYHVAATHESGSDKLYVNGSLENSGSAGSFSTSNAVNLRIGSAKIFGMYHQGLIDEVSFFNSALSASNVSSMINSGVPTDISSLNPVGWWRMGDGSDGSGNADGTLVNIGGTDFPQIYNVAEDVSGNRITGIDGSLTNISSPNGIVSDVPS